MRRPLLRFSLLVPCLFVTACSGGGGGGGGPQLPAAVPNGSGNVTIQMAGTWQVGSVSVVDSLGSVAPPADGTEFVLGPQGLVSIAGLSVAQADLEALLGAPLESYVNQLDGRTVLYGLVVDQRASGGTREQAALAGGALGDNSIAVEGYTSSQAANEPQARFVLWRGVLSRTSPAMVLPEPPVADGGGDDAAAAEALAPALLRR